MQFSEIYGAIEDVIKLPGGSKRDIAKIAANMAYLEMLHADDVYPLYWLRRLDDSIKVRAPLTITGITAASPPVVTVSALPVSWDNNLVIIHGVVGMTEVNGRLFLVDDSNTVAGTFELQDLTATDITGASFTAWSSGGTVYNTGIKITSIDQLLSWALFDPTDSTPYDPGEIILPDQFNVEWDENDSRPYRAMLLKENQSGTEVNYLVWGPGSDDLYGARIWKTIPATALSSDTDIPLIPTEYHYGIVCGGIARLMESNVQVENAVVWPGLYNMTVAQMVAHNRRLWKVAETRGVPFGL